MNIQANLNNTSLIASPKKPVSTSANTNKESDQKQTTNTEKSNQLAANTVERAVIVQQIEVLNNSQKANFRSSDIENKNQKLIQSYIDNQALESQPLRDELHEQLGIDFTV